MLYVIKEVIKKFAWVWRISGGWSLKLGNLLWAGYHQSTAHFYFHMKLQKSPYNFIFYRSHEKVSAKYILDVYLKINRKIKKSDITLLTYTTL